MEKDEDISLKIKSIVSPNFVNLASFNIPVEGVTFTSLVKDEQDIASSVNLKLELIPDNVSTDVTEEGKNITAKISLFDRYGNPIKNSTTNPYPVTLSLSDGGSATDFDVNFPIETGIPIGSNTVTVSIPVKEDLFLEPKEKYKFTASTSIGTPSKEISNSNFTSISDKSNAGVRILAEKIQDGKEGGNNLEYKFKLSGGMINKTGHPIQLAIQYGGSYSPFDFERDLPTNVEISDGSNSTQEYSRKLNDDSLLEGSENVTFKVISSSLNGIELGSFSEATAVLEDNDAPKYSLRQISGSESSEIKFIIELESPNSSPNPIVFEGNFTGSAGISDFNEPSFPSTFSIAPGSSSTEIVLNTKDDGLFEGDENITLTLTKLDGAIIPEISSTATIYDADSSSINLDVTGVDGSEITQSPVKFTFTLSKANNTKNPIAITWDFTGRASMDDFSQILVNGVAYTQTTLPTSISIPVGSRSASLELVPKNDNIFENNENLQLTVASSRIPSIATGQSATSVLREENITGLSVSSISNSNEEGETNSTFKVSLPSSNFSSSSIVLYPSFSGTETQNDFSTRFPRSIEIPVGEQSSTITLKASDDNLIESLETLKITFTEAKNSNYISSDISASSSIEDNDSSDIEVSIKPIKNGNELGSKPIVFRVSISKKNNTGHDLILKPKFIFEGSSDPSGFVSIPTEIVIPDNEFSTDVILVPVQDELFENTEVSKLSILKVDNPTIKEDVTSTGGMLLDATNRGSAKAVITAVGEEEGRRDLKINVYLRDSSSGKTVLNETGRDIVLNLNLKGIGLTLEDFIGVSSISNIPVTIAQGASSSAVINLKVKDDNLFEGDEKVAISINSSSEPLLNIDSKETTLLKDNDGGISSIPITITGTNGKEGETPATFTVSIGRVNVGGSTILSVDFSAGTAEQKDFTTRLPSVIKIPKGELSTTISLEPLDDSYPEDDESLILTVTGINNKAFIIPAPTEVKIINNGEKEKELTISNNGITPNGDNVNDVFKIIFDRNRFDSELYVYRRANELVYYKKGYDNSWGGVNKSGNPLPFGNYYYVVVLTDKKTKRVKTYNGYLYIKYTN